MPQIANIVLKDGQATPVNRTFAPAKTTEDYALLEDRAPGIYIGYNKLVFEMKRPQGDSKSATRNIKLHVRIETPILENVTNSTVAGIAPAPTISYRPMVEMTFTLPERCSLQNRKDLHAHVKDLVLNTFFQQALENYDLPY